MKRFFGGKKELKASTIRLYIDHITLTIVINFYFSKKM
jgi:hypothetical protein